MLSGGGAKGLAHVGVLKVLEDLGIRPDFITGTSMGSIIGGLYALGYDAQTLDSLVRSQDWDRVLSDRIPLNQVIFEEKLFFENELIEFPFDGYKLKTPGGLIYGQEISKLLNKLTLPYYDIEQFCELPIPFQCIGADIVKGEAIVLEDGILPEAMRISMAIPTVFTPIKKDSILFVDGGLIHNFPVVEAKDMGADIIIGVYTGRKLADKENLESFSDILLQSVFLLGIQDAELQKSLCNVYIEPELGEYSALDFNEFDSIIHRGEIAAKAQLEALEELVVSLSRNQNPPLTKTPEPIEGLYVDTIMVEGNELVPLSQILGRFILKPKSYMRIVDIEGGIDDLFGTNYFKRVTYRIQRVDDQNILKIILVEKSPGTLRLALNYDSYLGAGVLFNFTFRNLLMPASRFILGGKAAVNYRFNIDFLKYLDKTQKFAVNTRIHFNRDELPVFQEGIRGQEFRLSDFLIDTRVQQRFGRNLLVGIGGQKEQLSFRPIAGTDLQFRALNYINNNYYLFASYDSFDRNNFPRSGTRLYGEFKGLHLSNLETEGLQGGANAQDSLFNADPYFSLKLNGTTYLAIDEKSQLRISPFLSILFNSKNAFQEFFLVGAPNEVTRRSIPFYGLDANELIVEGAFGGGVGYEYFLRENLMFSLNANIGWFNFPFGVNNKLITEADLFLTGIGVTIGYNSFLGPIRCSFTVPSHSEGGIPSKLRTFLHIGHRF